MKDWLEQLKPAVGKSALVLLAGVMWVCVGMLLLSHAVAWLRLVEGPSVLWFVLPGFCMALVIHHFGFLRIVDRNLGRIRLLEGKRCAFSFIPLKSYGMIVVMICLGIGLRHSPIPKPYLAVFYLAIGAALILSSVRYLRVLLWKPKGGEDGCVEP